MRKTTILALVAIFLLLVFASFLLWFFFFLPTMQSAEYDAIKQEQIRFTEQNSHTAEQSVPLLLDSREDLLGEDVGAVAYFGWVGSMELTLDGVAVYGSMEDAGVEQNEYFHDMSGLYRDTQMVFVLCDITLKNIDAEPDPIFRSDYFSIGAFHLFIEQQSFLPPDARTPVGYFSGTFLGASPKDGYSFSLVKGEVGHYRLGFFVPKDDIYKPCALQIGINAEPPSSSKYQICFTIESDRVKGIADG